MKAWQSSSCRSQETVSASRGDRHVCRVQSLCYIIREVSEWLKLRCSYSYLRLNVCMCSVLCWYACTAVVIYQTSGTAVVVYQVYILGIATLVEGVHVCVVNIIIVCNVEVSYWFIAFGPPAWRSTPGLRGSLGRLRPPTPPF